MTTEERLAEIERKIDRLCILTESHVQRFEAHALEQKERNDRIGATLYGRNGTPGLLVRLDRLEQSGERARWLLRVVVGAVVTLLVGAVWALLR